MHGDNACRFHGFEKYDWRTDRNETAMFWLYFEDDYKYLAQHSGKKIVVWHGTDVQHFATKFAGKFVNEIRNPEIKHICLNYITQGELAQMGIMAELRYIFWGDASKYTRQTVFTKDAYMSANAGRGPEYGEFLINTLAWRFKDWNFHIFGIDPTISVYCDNIKYYGWIAEDVMDDITKNFKINLRLNMHDGFPQAMCKALLRGQEAITRLYYDNLTHVARDYRELVMKFEAIADGVTLNGQPDVKTMINNFDI